MYSWTTIPYINILTMYSRYSVAATVCSITFPILASIAVVSRLWARKAQTLRYGPDDYVLVFALVGESCMMFYSIAANLPVQCLTIALCCITLYSSSRANFGRPVSTMTPHELIIFQKVRSSCQGDEVNSIDYCHSISISRPS